VGGCGLDSSGSWQGPVTGSCEHSTDPSGSIKGKKFNDYYMRSFSSPCILFCSNNMWQYLMKNKRLALELNCSSSAPFPISKLWYQQTLHHCSFWIFSCRSRMAAHITAEWPSASEGLYSIKFIRLYTNFKSVQLFFSPYQKISTGFVYIVIIMYTYEEDNTTLFYLHFRWHVDKNIFGTQSVPYQA
jgi:hypothetical protein